MLVTAIKANTNCKPERQSFSVLRSTPIGKHIEPEIAKEAAISLIDCFHRLYIPLYQVILTLSKSSADVLLWTASKAVEIARTRSILMSITSDAPALS